jgi:putative copper export protein
MIFFTLLWTIHIISSAIWFGAFPADLILRKSISANKGKSGERKLISSWLKVLNISGIIGMSGILVTGILMSIVRDYGFFQFASGANHWLYTKQFLMIIIVLVIGVLLIPSAKKIRLAIQDDLESQSPLAESTYANIKKLGNLATIVNVIVLLNILLAASRHIFQ